MVKRKALLVFALGAMMAMGHMSAPAASSGMKEFAEDYAANKGVGLHVLRAEGAGFEYSKTFVQSGVNEAGEDVLRFATAVKGEVESLSYTRFALDGAPAGSAQAMDNVVPVTTLYRSIEVSDGKSAYYNGETQVNDATEATEGWYWACYSITYTSSTFKASDVRVQLTAEVGGESKELEERSMSLNKVKLPNMEAYEGNKYSGDVSFEVLDKYTAKATYSGCEIEAAITDKDGEFLVFGDSENGFKALFSYNRVTVKKFVYNGENKMSSKESGYDGTLLGRLTEGALRVKFSQDGYQYVNTEETYNYFTTKSQSIYFAPSTKDVTLSYSADNDNVTLTSGNGTNSYRYVKVAFDKAGEVNVTISVTDNYGTTNSATVKFNVTEAVYPTEDDFDILYSVVGGGDLRVDGQAQFDVEWHDNDTINQDKTITWSIHDDYKANATIGSSSGLLTAKKKGKVVVVASVKGENNSDIKKSTAVIEIQEKLEGTFPSEIVGVWEGEDDNENPFTFTVNLDGTALLEYDDWDGEHYSWEFKCLDEHKSGDINYTFTYNDNDEIKIYINLSASTFDIDDDIGLINDYFTFSCLYGSLDISKSK